MLKRAGRWLTSLSLLAAAAAVPTCQFDDEGNIVDPYGGVVVKLAAQTRPETPPLRSERDADIHLSSVIQEKEQP